MKIRVPTRWALVVALASRPPSVQAEPRMEAGGYAGATFTTMRQTFECPQPPDPLNPCVIAGQPNEGAVGVSLGAYVRYAVVPPVQVEANLLYAQKGYGGGNPVRMHYLEAPIVVRVDSSGFTAPARVFAFVGLAPAVDLWCHESGTRFDNDLHMAVPYSDACGSWPFFPRAPNRLDLGAVAGGGVGWPVSFGVVELQARYVQGLIDNGAWGDAGKTVNRAFYLLAGYGRTIGKP